MYIIKMIFIYILTSFIPLMLLYLGTQGLFRIILSLAFIFSWTLVFVFKDKFILLFLQAREIVGADSQMLFQSLKSETYRTRESFPSVYLYSGHRVKVFVLNARNGWSIVIDRKLLKSLNQEQVDALVSYLVEYKKNGQSELQTLGMGIATVSLRSIYWFWGKIGLKTDGRAYKICVFISCLFVKPMIEIIYALTKSKTKIECRDALKSVYLQVDKAVLERSFIEFMFLQLEENIKFSDIIIEYLESYPLLENCKFRVSL